MRLALTLAHPLPGSLSHRFADHLQAGLTARRHEVQRLDLYQTGFQPALTPEERTCYYDSAFDDTAGLQDIEGLILVFPTWWFGLPAILKGWIDRSFLPGVAYHHATDGGTLKPGLPNLRAALAVTTMGSPAFYDCLIARRPVYHALKYGVVKPCAPRARFKMHTLYKAETLTAQRIAAFETQLSKTATQLFPTQP